jgi:D-alanine-D-alanine ligase
MTQVTVLTGGSTPEREVALAGAAQVVAALRGVGYAVTVVDTVHGVLDEEEEHRLLVPRVGPTPPTTEELRLLSERECLPEIIALGPVREADVVFLVLHGRQGEGGAIQALLDAAGVPYAGSGPLGSALAMDKDIAKRLFRDAGIPTPDWVMWPAHDAAVAALAFPLVVKPSKAGSTVGLTVVQTAAELPDAVRLASAYDDEVMLERFVPGREYTVGVLEEQPLAVGEIVPSHEIFDYECKYTPGLTREIFPAQLPEATTRRLRGLAAQAHRVLKLRDFSRVDFRCAPDGTAYCLEVNTLPGLTGTSLLPQSAAAVGVSFPELCDRICRAALRRARPRNNVRASGM